MYELSGTGNAGGMAMNKNDVKKNSILRKLGNHIKDFFFEFFEHTAIHGFLYLSKPALHYIEKLFWLALITVSGYFCVQLGLESWDRYLTKSTVVSIEKDYYYWNTSLPSLTICPMKRIHTPLFDDYCSKYGITGQTKDDFFEFIESLANSTYFNFQDIKQYDSVDELLLRLNIQPEHYMALIYELTLDLTRIENLETRVRNIINLEFIRSLQVLTEYGICYTTNNFIAPNLTTNWLLNHQPNTPNPHYLQKSKLYDVRFGNLFDGDMTYSFIGFQDAITIFIHSPYETINLSRKRRYTNDAFEYQASSIEVLTSKKFKEDTTIAQRGCRFSTESNLTHYGIYTKELCLQECRLNLALKHCGCIPHFYPNNTKEYRRSRQVPQPKPVCHYKRLKQCFPPRKEFFMEFHEPGGGKTIRCNCLMNCVTSNVLIEKIQVLTGFAQLLGSIGGLMNMKNYPLIRYQRQILFTFTDLLVSIGGTAGFFLGFSVLGLVEIFYFYTLRLFGYIIGRR